MVSRCWAMSLLGVVLGTVLTAAAQQAPPVVQPLPDLVRSVSTMEVPEKQAILACLERHPDNGVRAIAGAIRNGELVQAFDLIFAWNWNMVDSRAGKVMSLRSLIVEKQKVRESYLAQASDLRSVLPFADALEGEQLSAFATELDRKAAVVHREIRDLKRQEAERMHEAVESYLPDLYRLACAQVVLPTSQPGE